MLNVGEIQKYLNEYFDMGTDPEISPSEIFGSIIMHGCFLTGLEILYEYYGSAASKWNSLFKEKCNKVDRAYMVGDCLFELVDNFGGTEQGSEYWGVARFSKGDESILVRVNGRYASYSGTSCYDYNNWIVVEEVKKVISQYIVKECLDVNS